MNGIDLKNALLLTNIVLLFKIYFCSQSQIHIHENHSPRPIMVSHNYISMLITGIIISMCQHTLAESQNIPSWIYNETCYNKTTICYRFNSGICSDDGKNDIRIKNIGRVDQDPSIELITTGFNSTLITKFNSCDDTTFGITARNSFNPFTPTRMDNNIITACNCTSITNGISLDCQDLRLGIVDSGLFLYETNNNMCINSPSTFILLVLRNSKCEY